MAKYIDNRNWQRTNEKYVKRGEFYFSMEFLNDWDKELKQMNKNKVGKPYEFPVVFIQFFYFIKITLHIPS